MSDFSANQIAKDVRELLTAITELNKVRYNLSKSHYTQLDSMLPMVKALNKLMEKYDQLVGSSASEDRPGPKKIEWYDPQESPTMYPLELDSRLHINLWAKHGMSKYTIAMFVRGSEGYDLQFLGRRPFDRRVNWDDFLEVVKQGQNMADARYQSEEVF